MTEEEKKAAEEKAAAEKAAAEKAAAEKAAAEKAAADKAAAEKAATEDALDVKAKKLFRDYPGKDELYFTSDGVAFFTQNAASNHGATLKDKSVVEKKRQ